MGKSEKRIRLETVLLRHTARRLGIHCRYSSGIRLLCVPRIQVALVNKGYTISCQIWTLERELCSVSATHNVACDWWGRTAINGKGNPMRTGSVKRIDKK